MLYKNFFSKEYIQSSKISLFFLLIFLYFCILLHSSDESLFSQRIQDLKTAAEIDSVLVLLKNDDSFSAIDKIQLITHFYQIGYDLVLDHIKFYRIISTLEKDPSFSYDSLKSTDLGIIFDVFGQICLHAEQYSKAEKFYKRSHEIYLQNNNNLAIVKQKIKRSKIYYQKQKYDLAISNLNEIHALLQNLNATKIEKEINQIYSDSYLKMQDFEKALEHRVKYFALKDSVYHKEKKQQINDIQNQYETHKKEQEIELLKKKKEIHRLEIDKKQKQRNVIIVIAISLGLITIGLYNRNKYKTRKNLELASINHKIQEQTIKLEKIHSEQETLVQELNQVNSTKNKFFSIISLDLKNAFTSLISGSELLTTQIDDLDKNNIKKMGEQLKYSTKKLLKLLENLLHWVCFIA